MNGLRSTRREFLKEAVMGTAGVAAGLRVATLGGIASADTYTARVAITKGNDRADNAFRALQFFKKQIAAAIDDKRVIVKPNLVEPTNALACTSADWLEGILEFLKSIGKTNVAIAESSATGGTTIGFDSMGYRQLANKYPVRLMDLNQEGYDKVRVWYRASDATPNTTIRITNLYRAPRNFIISAARIKTHNFAVATLALKNVAMSAPIVDIGKYLGQPGWKDNKWAGMHGEGGSQVLTDNIYRLARFYGCHPHLAVIDGYQGMQGDGPTGGYAVNPPQKLGIASLDWVAADRVCVSLMGHDGYLLGSTGPYPACLNYCAQAGMGEWDINKIEVLGGPIAGNVVNYTPHSTISAQLGLRTTPRE